MHRTEIQHHFEDMHFVRQKVPRVLGLLLDCSLTSSPRKRSCQRRCAAQCAPKRHWHRPNTEKCPRSILLSKQIANALYTSHIPKLIASQTYIYIYGSVAQPRLPLKPVYGARYFILCDVFFGPVLQPALQKYVQDRFAFNELSATATNYGLPQRHWDETTTHLTLFFLQSARGNHAVRPNYI
jgi:hypothetical protein